MAFGHKAFTKSRPNRGRMSKIWVEVVARSNVQQKDDLNIEKYIECTDDSSRQRRLEGRHTQTTSTSTYTQNHDTKSSKSRPFIEKNRPFAEIFHPTIWNCRKFSIYLPHRKTFTTHSFTTSIHTIECFSRQRDIYNQRASSK